MIYLFLYLFSLLPLRLMYMTSDLFYYVIYYILRYRRKVVWENIENSFGSLNAKEKDRIIKSFYKNFCDNIFETIKLLSMNEREIHKRVQVDYSEIENVLRENKNCHVYLGHQFNWELANLHISSILKYSVNVVYKPLSNKSFDLIMKKMRGRFGSILIPSNKMKKEMTNKNTKSHVLILVADQNPNIPSKSFWTTFLQQKTAFLNGPEIYTASSKTQSFFANIVRVKRGYYKIEISTLFDFSKPYKMGVVTWNYSRKLQNSIIKNPQTYLWSHRRWKQKYKEEYKGRYLKNFNDLGY